MTQDFNDMNHRLESSSMSPVAQSGFTIKNYSSNRMELCLMLLECKQSLTRFFKQNFFGNEK